MCIKGKLVKGEMFLETLLTKIKLVKELFLDDMENGW